MTYFENDTEYSFCHAYFSADEYIIWRGKHSGKLAGQSAATILFGLFFLAFTVIWTISALSVSAIMSVFCLPFVAVGIYLAFGKVIMDRSSKYVITNRRIYRKRSGKVDMLDIASLPPMRTVEHRGGCGSIYFGENYYRAPGGKPRYGMTFSIDCVDNVAEVQRIISDLINDK